MEGLQEGRLRPNPYPGPRPFERGEDGIFFGREREISEIASLLVAQPVVVVYSQSGAGKTSLLHAGLLPFLEQKGFEVLPVARVRGSSRRRETGEAHPNVFVHNTLLSWTADDPSAPDRKGLTLPAYLQRGPSGTTGDEAGEEGAFPLRLVVFDQFEELFTTYPDRWADRGPFFSQLDRALGADPYLRVLLLMREDFLADLKPHEGLVTGRLKTRYRLERLDRRAAMRAVNGPAASLGRPFSESAAEALVDHLLEIRVQDGSGRTRSGRGEHAEPVQLQIVCRDLWDQVPPDATEITEAHLAEGGDVDLALRTFYEKAVAQAVRKSGVSERTLRAWVDKELITPASTRGTVFQGPEETAGIPNRAVEELETVRLVRSETRAGGRWFELTHDRFIGPIQESNRHWFILHARTRVFTSSPDESPSGSRHTNLLLAELGRRKLVHLGIAMVLLILAAITPVLLYARQQRKEAEGARHRLLLSHLARGADELLTQDPALARTLALQAALQARDTRLPEMRISEGLLLQSTVTSPVRLTVPPLDGYSGPVTSMAAALYTGEMAVVHAGQRVSLWDPDTGTGRPCPDTTFSGIRDVALSPEGDRMALAMDDATVTLWDVDSGILLATLKGHRGAVTAVAFSPGGSLLASGGAGGAVWVWDARSGLDLYDSRDETERGRVLDLTFDESGEWLAAGTALGSVLAWDLRDAGERRWFRAGRDSVNAVAFTPDRLVTVSSGPADSEIAFWKRDSLPSREGAGLPPSLVADTVPDRILLLDASAGDGRVVTSHESGGLRLWNEELAEPYQLLSGPREGVSALTLLSRGMAMASGSPDGSLAFWDLPAILRVGGPGGSYRSSFSSDGSWLLTGGQMGNAMLWRLSGDASPVFVRSFAPAEAWERILDVELSPDDRLVATTHAFSTPKIWDAWTGLLLDSLVGHAEQVNDLDFDGDGTRIGTASDDGTARIWDAVTGATLVTLVGHRGRVIDMDFSPDGNRVATASADSTVAIWDARTGVLLHELKGHRDWVKEVDYSPNGAMLVTGDWGGQIRSWDAVTGDSIHVFSGTGHSGQLTSVTFAAGGSRLISGSTDGTVRVWDPILGKEVAAFFASSVGVTDLALDPEERVLATSFRDGSVHLLPFHAGRPRDAARMDLAVLDPETCLRFMDAEDCSGRGSQRVLRAREILRQGEVAGAEKALGKDFVSLVGPEELRRVGAAVLRRKAAILAVAGEREEAVRDFREAAELEGGEVEAGLLVDSIARASLMRTAENLARAGRTEDADRLLRQAPEHLWLAARPSHETLELMAAQGLLARARNAARAGDSAQAGELLDRTRLLKPELLAGYERFSDFRDLEVSSLLTGANRLALEGKIAQAVDSLEAAREVYRRWVGRSSDERSRNPLPNVPAEASQILVEAGQALTLSFRILEADSAFRAAERFDPQLVLSVDDLNLLCWRGALLRLAEKVMERCTAAVTRARSEGDEYLPGILDSRGVARALTGDIDGAIEDFRRFIESGIASKEAQSRRLRWIEALRSGRDPFTDEELKQLRDEVVDLPGGTGSGEPIAAGLSKSGTPSPPEGRNGPRGP